MAVVSPFRTPWTAALLLLVVIWTIWLFGIPASSRSPSLPDGPIKDAIDMISNPLGMSFSGTGDQKDSKAKELDSKVNPTTTGISQTEKSKSIPSGTKMETTSVTPFPDSKLTSGIANKTSTSSPSPSDRPLILYAFYETSDAIANLQFFLRHGLHGGADFVFILKGDTKINENVAQEYWDHPNVQYVKRPNTCFDLGSYAEVLTTNDLYKNYKRFILLNASIRGPYLPYWLSGCWSEMYLSKVTETTKLVGMTANCWPSFHVQSMIWATDITGLELLLHPPPDPSKPENEQPLGINHCFSGWDEAVTGEIGASGIITRAGYKLDVMMAAFHGSNYVENCDSSKNGDVLWQGAYEGTNVHPYDTMFLKTNRNVDPAMINKFTEWTDWSKYSSWDHCPS